MSLSQALSTAISGLRVNQSGLALVAANVANANTPGYIRKTVNQVSSAGDNIGISVNIGGIQRELDQYVQRQLRAENSGATYADTRAQFYQQLQGIYGQPGSTNTLETVYNNFTNALQALSTSPDDLATRSSVISNAQLLAQQLNQLILVLHAHALEQLDHPLLVLGGHAPELPLTFRRELDVKHAPVRLVNFTDHESLLLETIGDAGDVAAGHHHALRQLAHL